VGTLAGAATTGTYPNTSLTGGSGTGAAATVVITGGTVSAITITTAGIGYVVGDTLGWSVTGGSGTCHIATLNTAAAFAQDGICVARCKVTATGLGGSITLNNASDSLSTTVNHPGNGTVDLVIGAYMPAGSSPQLIVSANGDATVVFDECSLKMTFDAIDNTDYYNSWPTRNLAT
jgi:hypothetical protein